MQNNFKYINLSWAVVGICENDRHPLLVHIPGIDKDEDTEHAVDAQANAAHARPDEDQSDDDSELKEDQCCCHILCCMNRYIDLYQFMCCKISGLWANDIYKKLTIICKYRNKWLIIANKGSVEI